MQATREDKHETAKKKKRPTHAPLVWSEVTRGEYFGRSSTVASGWIAALTTPPPPLLPLLAVTYFLSVVWLFPRVLYDVWQHRSHFLGDFSVYVQYISISSSLYMRPGIKSLCAAIKAFSSSDLRAEQRTHGALLLVCVALNCLVVQACSYCQKNRNATLQRFVSERWIM